MCGAAWLPALAGPALLAVPGARCLLRVPLALLLPVLAALLLLAGIRHRADVAGVLGSVRLRVEVAGILLPVIGSLPVRGAGSLLR
jgi:hypothetical protein